MDNIRPASFALLLDFDQKGLAHIHEVVANKLTYLGLLVFACIVSQSFSANKIVIVEISVNVVFDSNPLSVWWRKGLVNRHVIKVDKAES